VLQELLPAPRVPQVRVLQARQALVARQARVLQVRALPPEEPVRLVRARVLPHLRRPLTIMRAPRWHSMLPLVSSSSYSSYYMQFT